MEPKSKSPSGMHHMNIPDSGRFFIIKTKETFTNVSPFFIENAISRNNGSFNFSRGVISAVNFLNVSSEEILENRGDQKVCGVRRITIRKDAQVLNKKHLILMFSTPDLPESVKMAKQENTFLIRYDVSIVNNMDIQRTCFGASQPAIVAGRRVTTVTTAAKKD
ncbi:hypothetical protein TNCV_3807261 [Trichonephila clavipes]|nr:hypothetical protein TNCV_3807261 [Trichonephila clavipes]